MGKRKAATSEDNPNHDFCEFLEELAEYEKNVTRNIYKYNAYRKAASVLAAHPTRIRSGEEARKLNGVGDKISKKIDEFLQTGKLRKLEAIHEDSTNAAINELTRVSGIGPAKAQSLVREGITSIEKLREHIHKLNHHQILGLKYVDDFEKKIPRSEIEDIELILQNQVTEFDSSLDIVVCGSYRRGKEESGDIDALLTHTDYLSTDEESKKIYSGLLKKIVLELQRARLVTEIMSLGETKFMGACKLDSESITRRLDIRFVPYDQYYCAILYFTGSDMFNKQMRAHALEMGFTLNEYSLRPIGSTGVPGEPVEIHSERDIFDYIDYPYKEPHERSL